MKVLITGGAGFLGTRLARALLQRKHLMQNLVVELVLADLTPPAAELAHDPRVKMQVG